MKKARFFAFLTASLPFIQKIADFFVKWYLYQFDRDAVKTNVYFLNSPMLIGFIIPFVSILTLYFILTIKEAEKEIAPLLIASLCVFTYMQREIGVILLIAFLVKIRFHLFPILRGSNPNS